MAIFRFSSKIFSDFLTNLDTTMANGSIAMYSGSPPASPDAAATGTYLGRVTSGGGAWVAGSATNGINTAAPSSGTPTMSKESAESWVFTCSATGTIGWGRYVANPTDAGGISTVLPRMDFDVGLTGSGAACTMTKTAFTTIGETGVVQTFTLPFTNRV